MLRLKTGDPERCARAAGKGAQKMSNRIVGMRSMSWVRSLGGGSEASPERYERLIASYGALFSHILLVLLVVLVTFVPSRSCGGIDHAHELNGKVLRYLIFASESSLRASPPVSERRESP